MGRLGQLHVSVGLAFLIAASSVTACSSTGTPDAELASPTTTTARTTTGETEALVVDAADASSPATSIQTTDPSSFEQLCGAVLLWSLAMGMLSLGQIEDMSLEIIERNETIDIEGVNEQLHDSFREIIVPVEDIPYDYIVILEEILGLVSGAMDGSLSDEHQEFADAYLEFIGERMETFIRELVENFATGNLIRFSSLSIDDLPNVDVVTEECGLP